MNTITKLRGTAICDVILKHGGRLQSMAFHNVFEEFDTLEAAIACARELEAGGVRVEGVRAGEPGHSDPTRRMPVLTYRPD